jgi:NAD(P)-dependent dehydrogenase (short-subunit alcohol dehydrogenase family)
MAEAGQKIAIVTGAGTGVGRAASLALINSGFAVVLAGRRLEMLQETQRLGGNAAKSLCVSADMTDPGSIAALFAKVTKLAGSTYSFNNAGMGAPPVNLRSDWRSGSRREHQSHRAIPSTQHAFRIMKDQNARRPHHQQQRLDLGTRRGRSRAHLDQPHHWPGRASNLDGRQYTSRSGRSTSAMPQPR